MEGEETQSDFDFLHLPGISGVNYLPNFVSMCAIAELLNVIHFDSYSPMQMPPEDRLMAIHVRCQTRAALQWLLRTHTLVDEENHWRDADVIRGTCVHWAKGLIDGKTDSEKSEIQPRVPGLTVDALRRKLDGSLGGNWESEISHASHSFALIRTLSIRRRKGFLPSIRKFKFCLFFISGLLILAAVEIHGMTLDDKQFVSTWDA